MAFSEEWYETELKSSELETLHRPPTVEYSFYTAVKTGDMETVVANCKEDAFIHLEGTGVLSRNALTNIKYHFVVTAAMLTRYCIDGGLEPEQAYRQNGVPISSIHLQNRHLPSVVRNKSDPTDNRCLLPNFSIVYTMPLPHWGK